LNSLPKLSVRPIFCSFIAAVLFSACKADEAPKILPPANWQAQLQPAYIGPDFVPAMSESVYVPIYSHIYYEDNQHQLTLVGTLSIRNTDANNSLILKSIRYYDTKGQLKENLLDHPVKLGPFATADVVVPRTNDSGGSGANFVVDWISEEKIAEPLIEAVMVSTGASQSVSFVSRGVVTVRSGASLDSASEPKKPKKPKG
jgi:Protein of unknown function (DUF3124)